MTRKRTEDATVEDVAEPQDTIDATTQDVVADVPEDTTEDGDESAGDDEIPGTSYRVLKAITLGNGQTLMPGDTLAIAENDPDWPARRPGQLVKQGYLRPLENI